MGAGYLCAPTLTGASAMMPAAWRDVPGPWLTHGASGACGMGAADGSFVASYGADQSGAFELRVLVSGASFDAALSGEDVGLVEFELLAR